MENGVLLAVPKQALLRLEFLVGDYTGVQTLYPPEGKVVSYPAWAQISREACDRFVKVEFYAEVPEMGIESFTSFLTYGSRKSCYQMWQFSSSSEEPLHLAGDFLGQQLVLVSDPWSMPWGLQRLRGTFSPYSEGSFEYLLERWEPDGYTKFRTTHFQRKSVDL